MLQVLDSDFSGCYNKSAEGRGHFYLPVKLPLFCGMSAPLSKAKGKLQDSGILIGGTMATRAEKQAAARQLEIERNKGFIYLLRSENGYYKIGITKDVNHRLKEFLSWPISVELVHSFETSGCLWVEKQLHDRFLAKRFRGEWFKLDKDDVSWFISLEDYDARFEKTLAAIRKKAEKDQRYWDAVMKALSS